MSRRILIAGNWKMNKTSAEGAALVKEIAAGLPAGSLPEILVCPPYLTIPAVVEAAKGSALEVGAENVHWAASGAYTGEVSTAMLLDAGVTHVIVGHSERRQYFGETDETVNQRARAAVEAGLVAVICVGETLAEREAGETAAVIDRHASGHGAVPLRRHAAHPGEGVSPARLGDAFRFGNEAGAEHFGKDDEVGAGVGPLQQGRCGAPARGGVSPHRGGLNQRDFHGMSVLYPDKNRNHFPNVIQNHYFCTFF
jgi:hypothetical protein